MADERLIPASVNDASARAYNEMAELLGGLDTTVLLVYFIDNVPAAVLPALADQFRITPFEWRLAQSEVDQRELIKSAIERRRYKGTPYAIELGMEVLHLAGKVVEWFEYGGAPYYFRVDVDLSTRGFDPATELLLYQMIAAYKNRRSWLDKTIISLINSGNSPVHGGVCCYGETITILSGD